MPAVIYSRISDDPRGKAAGVERQADECRALAATRGVDVVDVIVDNDISATSGKRRPGFERVTELVRAGVVDTIVVWHTDRLYPLPRDLEPLIALADSRPVRFLTVAASELDLNTPSGRMVARDALVTWHAIDPAGIIDAVANGLDGDDAPTVLRRADGLGLFYPAEVFDFVSVDLSA
jgi:DNA invertase Pin-like site-specific DNA recombinase